MEKIQDVLFLFAQEVRKLMGKDLKKLLVYGSYARGDYNVNSDVDIMILISIEEDKIEQMEDVLYDKAFDFLMKYGIQISVIVKNEEHFNYWLGANVIFGNSSIKVYRTVHLGVVPLGAVFIMFTTFSHFLGLLAGNVNNLRSVP